MVNNMNVNVNKMNNWKCTCCKKKLTHYNETENEIHADTHFDIERSYKDLHVDDDGDNCIIEENLANRNVKMSREICENCFNKILNESPTLRKTFECRIDGKINIIY